MIQKRVFQSAHGLPDRRFTVDHNEEEEPVLTDWKGPTVYERMDRLEAAAQRAEEMADRLEGELAALEQRVTEA